MSPSSDGFQDRPNSVILSQKAKASCPKNHDTFFLLSIGKSPTLHAVLFDTLRCVSRFSTLYRLSLHVNFPLSTLNFQLKSLFCMSACHADLTLS